MWNLRSKSSGVSYLRAVRNGVELPTPVQADPTTTSGEKIPEKVDSKSTPTRTSRPETEQLSTGYEASAERPAHWCALLDTIRQQAHCHRSIPLRGIRQAALKASGRRCKWMLLLGIREEFHGTAAAHHCPQSTPTQIMGFCHWLKLYRSA